jgi:hypothetical protein
MTRRRLGKCRGTAVCIAAAVATSAVVGRTGRASRERVQDLTSLAGAPRFRFGFRTRAIDLAAGKHLHSNAVTAAPFGPTEAVGFFDELPAGY